jgi:hypothetical protein
LHEYLRQQSDLFNRGRLWKPGSQANRYRYGNYIAKFRVTPITPALKSMKDDKLDISQDENALRTDVTGFLRQNAAEYEIGIQLCTNLDAMPIENAHTEWSEVDSPYVPVARLVLPAQEAYSSARQACVENVMSFCPAHALAAHRSLGGRF